MGDKKIYAKDLTGALATTTKQILAGPLEYYGFTCRTNAATGTFRLYNGDASTDSCVEDWSVDSAKSIDGHDHNNPVHCKDGLYLINYAKKPAIIYYWRDRGN